MISSDETDLFETKPEKVNISASGMRFKSRESFHVGDLLDMKMILPTFPFRIVRKVVLIIRSEKLTGRQSVPGELDHCIAVKFLAMHEDDRGSIIRCFFTWQRKLPSRTRLIH